MSGTTSYATCPVRRRTHSLVSESMQKKEPEKNEPEKKRTPPETLPDVVEPSTLARRASKPDEDVDFVEFWTMYGRVGPRKVAWECWRRAMKNGAEPEDILDGLERWVAYWRTPGAAKVKWPQGWLNEERWKDPPPTAVAAVTRPVSKTTTTLAALKEWSQRGA